MAFSVRCWHCLACVSMALFVFYLCTLQDIIQTFHLFTWPRCFLAFQPDLYQGICPYSSWRVSYLKCSRKVFARFKVGRENKNPDCVILFALNGLYCVGSIEHAPKMHQASSSHCFPPHYSLI